MRALNGEEFGALRGARHRLRSRSRVRVAAGRLEAIERVRVVFLVGAQLGARRCRSGALCALASSARATCTKCKSKQQASKSTRAPYWQTAGPHHLQCASVQLRPTRAALRAARAAASGSAQRAC